MRRLIALVCCLTAFASTGPRIANAVSVASLNNPVPNGYIQIDGNLDDWLSVAHYPLDATGDGSTGLLWRSAGENMLDGFSNWIFFDMDRSETTGGRSAPPSVPAPGQIAIGYEFNLGGTIGWNAFNPGTGAFAGGAAGRTVATGNAIGTAGDDFIEWRISRTVAQPNGLTFNPTGGTQFRLQYIVEDTTGDFMPSNVEQDWFTYDTAGTYNPGAPGDGNNSGNVTIDDYLLIQANSFKRVLLGKNGDVDDNGFVDFADFQQWKTNFPGGVAAAEAAIAALPEPTGATLAAWAGTAFLWRRRRRRAH
jgi:hypothetical protein